MEVSFNLLLYLIIVLVLIGISVVFFYYIKVKGVNILEEILDIPNYLRKIFGG